ncbi:MAG: iron donor protein CyaY [Acidobacteria bacterium 13_1_40CM_4_58_4]|nr:MAG: iron donor protein CyaY [Acidobacteria bacterium 13_1_40CM_4_58_4]
MLDENDFRKRAESALGTLKKSLIAAEDSADLEVEDQAGALHISFEDGSRFVISPNAPVRQIWISALATSFKLDWSDTEQDFVLQKTGEKLNPLVARLINQQLGMLGFRYGLRQNLCSRRGRADFRPALGQGEPRL